MLNFVSEPMKHGVETDQCLACVEEGLDNWVCGLWTRLICFEWLLDKEGSRTHCSGEPMSGVAEQEGRTL